MRRTYVRVGQGIGLTAAQTTLGGSSSIDEGAEQAKSTDAKLIESQMNLGQILQEEGWYVSRFRRPLAAP